MPILRNIRTLCTGSLGGKQSDLRVIQGAALAWDAGKIRFVGPEEKLPTSYRQVESFDAHDALVVPGLIDCHTHLAFGGWRTDEFVEKCRGASYAEIAARGGGILSTVEKTRAASADELEARCFGFLSEMAALGVTTVEAKTGYGLNVEHELKLLDVYAALKKKTLQTLVPTLLAGHAIPPEYKSRRKEFNSLIIEELLPAAAKKKIASFCDVFVDTIAFSTEEARHILRAAQKLGMKSKLHVDQLSDTAGGALAAELEATSADHLEFVSDESIAAMAKKKVVGVILPLATLYTRMPPLDARRLISRNVPVAVATDFNPGSAPSFHLPLALMLSCTLNRLTPAEALNGATVVAAAALGIADSVGTLEEGKAADFLLLDAESVDAWLYHFRPNICRATVKAGACIYGKL